MTGNFIKESDVQEILKDSQVKVFTVFDKCTIVAVKLPNGFTICESTGCIDPENYSEEIGKEICLEKIIDKIWLLEGYNLQANIRK